MVEHIPCLYLPYDDAATKLIVYFHGNAEDIGLAFDLLYLLGQRLQMHVLAVEYPGYGLYKTSKAQADKLLGSSWSKVHEWSTSAGEHPEHLADLGLWRQLEGRGPCVVLTSGRSPSGQPAVFGAFWQGKVPSIPENFEPGPELAHRETMISN